MTKTQKLKSRKTIHIEWGDCDPAQIVHFPRFFAYFDACTTALFKKGRPLEASYVKNLSHWESFSSMSTLGSGRPLGLMMRSRSFPKSPRCDAAVFLYGMAFQLEYWRWNASRPAFGLAVLRRIRKDRKRSIPPKVVELLTKGGRSNRRTGNSYKEWIREAIHQAEC